MVESPVTMGHPELLDGGRYRLIERIGEGGAATVYRAEGPNGPCAVKLRPVPERQILAARFLVEPIPMARVEHPGVVRVEATGETDGFLWIAMELFPHGSVADLVRARGALSVPEACLCMEQVLDALAAVHEAGFVHRDVKPANIFLDDERGAVIGDFGVAKHVNTKLWFRTQSGQGIGTAAFRAPEQDQDAKSAGPPADIYGAAATLYFLATGTRHPLLYGSEANPRMLAALPDELVDVVARATRFDPAERTGSALEMQRQLRAVRLPDERLSERDAGSEPSGMGAWLRRFFGA